MAFVTRASMTLVVVAFVVGEVVEAGEGCEPPGLIAAGDSEGLEHSVWPLSTAEAILRIAVEWSSETDPFVMPGSIVWLNTTPAGQDLGESVWRREGRA